MLLSFVRPTLSILFLVATIAQSQYNISIIHFNDFHSRYQAVNRFSTSCGGGDNCIGGFSRLYATIKQLKKKNPDSLVLNAGDNFQGTLWYIVHKWNITQHFLNKLPLDAITLGNHEFDDGVDGLVPYLEMIKAPVVVSNINTTLESRLDSLYKKSVIIQNQGKKIGIIGVLTNSTQYTSRTENIIFEDESQSVNVEAERLVREAGVSTNIILSHCGYERDLEIASKSIAKISLIVGGHTDTFLFTGNSVPGPDQPSGPYPTVILNEEGKKVLVVQASAYTKYLGNINVIYDELDNVKGWYGEPIFLGPKISTDPDIDAELEVWKKSVDIEGNKVVGYAEFSLPNQPCRYEECSLGDLITDAMIFNYITKNEINNLNSRLVAIIHAGGMRAGIEKGNITFNQLVNTFPFQDTINLCKIKGKHIKQILESCVDNRHLKFPHMFQVSGLRIIYNISSPEGERVQSLKFCSTISKCKDIDLETYYHVLLPTFLSDTNFNPLFNKYLTNKIIGDRDTDAYKRFLMAKSPIVPKIEGRIQIKK